MSLTQRRIQLAAPLSPYLAVMVGLLVFRSAWLAVLCYQVLALLVVLVCRTSVGVLKPRSWALWGVALLFGFTGVVLALIAPSILDDGLLAHRLLSVGLNGGNYIWFAVWFSLINPVLEELLWRGILLRRGMRPCAMDALFGGYHAVVIYSLLSWPWAVAAFAGCSMAGWLWRIMCLKSEGLVLPMLAHFLADASIMAAVWWLCYR
ncbi:MAG: CPBP family intramembrane glutamic endopeptidase [Armatimonadota bacterium]